MTVHGTRSVATRGDLRRLMSRANSSDLLQGTSTVVNTMSRRQEKLTLSTSGTAILHLLKGDNSSAKFRDYSWAIFRGDYSWAIFTGDYSWAIFRGNYSWAKFRVDYSWAIFRGNYSWAIFRGDYSWALFRGNY